MNERKRSNKAIFYILFALALLGFVVVWRLFFVNVSFYVPAAVMLVFSMLPLFYNYEKAKSSTREITLVATMVALAVVSRAVFYLIPQVKPIAAVVVISAVCLGAERGFAVGALSAFVSNFIFGQGTKAKQNSPCNSRIRSVLCALRRRCRYLNYPRYVRTPYNPERHTFRLCCGSTFFAYLRYFNSGFPFHFRRSAYQ